MSKTRITADINDLLLAPLQKYADAHSLTVDFVLGVAIDQFLCDPTNPSLGVLAASERTAWRTGNAARKAPRVCRICGRPRADGTVHGREYEDGPTCADRADVEALAAQRTQKAAS